MLTVILPAKQATQIMSALAKAKQQEIGGILLGEHVDFNVFSVREITVQYSGLFASFLRRMEDALGKVHAFFRKTNHNYIHFNYIGEWHSHPSFEPLPSRMDDTSMLEIVQDDKVGANFVVLLIVKIDAFGKLIATAHTYLPNGRRYSSDVIIET